MEKILSPNLPTLCSFFSLYVGAARARAQRPAKSTIVTLMFVAVRRHYEYAFWESKFRFYTQSCIAVFTILSDLSRICNNNNYLCFLLLLLLILLRPIASSSRENQERLSNKFFESLISATKVLEAQCRQRMHGNV